MTPELTLPPRDDVSESTTCLAPDDINSVIVDVRTLQVAPALEPPPNVAPALPADASPPVKLTKADVAVKIKILHDEWIATHDKLYINLAGVLALATIADVKDLCALCDERGIEYDNRADAALLVMKLMTGDKEKKRTSSYATVVRHAQANNVDPSDLPAWIVSKGGIEKIRLAASKRAKDSKEASSKSTSDVPATTKITRTQNAYASVPAVASIPANGLAMTAAITTEGFTVMVGRRNADLSTSVVAYVTKISVVNTVLEAIGADLPDAEAIQATPQAQAPTFAAQPAGSPGAIAPAYVDPMEAAIAEGL